VNLSFIKFNHGIPWNTLNSMEFNGIPLNFPWNSMEKYNEKIRQMFMKNFMEFRQFHGIPWDSMEFHGIFHGKFHENSIN
jgi:hypothetical protein